jgi:hypothetical protein
MNSFEKLLATKNSFLAQTLWWGLYSLRASLKAAREDTSSDQGDKYFEEVIQELDTLLDQDKSPMKKLPSAAGFPQKNNSLPVNKTTEKQHRHSREPQTSQILTKLREAVLTAPDLRPYLGDLKLQSTNDADLWNEVQRLFLRLPTSLAESWRQRTLGIVEQVGVRSDCQNVIELPFRDKILNEREILYPGLTGSVQTPGLCLSATAPLDSRVVPRSREGDLNFLAGIVSTYLQFIKLDPFLHHALENLAYFTINSLRHTDEQTKYINELIERFQQVQKSESEEDTEAALEARIRLDEAIHSLVYQPLVAPDSWWGKLQQSARRTLNDAVAKARQANCQVQIRTLLGPYADIQTYSSKYDLEDIEESIGIPGEVSTCLRVFTKINNKKLPGRVIFRSLGR